MKYSPLLFVGVFVFFSNFLLGQNIKKDSTRELTWYEAEIFFYDKMSVGKKAPEFRFADMNGDSLILSQLKGKVVVFNAFFAACQPCIKEIPVLNKIKRKYEGKDVIFLAVSNTDTKEDLRLFQEKYKWEFKIIPIDYPENFRLSKNYLLLKKTYLIPLYPTTIIIDQDGLISYTNVGFTSEDDINGLDYMIDKLLKSYNK